MSKAIDCNLIFFLNVFLYLNILQLKLEILSVARESVVMRKIMYSQESRYISNKTLLTLKECQIRGQWREET